MFIAPELVKLSIVQHASAAMAHRAHYVQLTAQKPFLRPSHAALIWSPYWILEDEYGHEAQNIHTS